MAVGWLAVLAAPAPAQYLGGGGSEVPGGGGGFSDPLRERYNKAKHGANIDEWVRRLKEEEPERRLEAVKSLGESGDPKANDYLMQAVADPDPRIQSKAVDYLGRIRATEATVFLVQRLFVKGTNEALRHRILMALGKIGDSRAARPVLEFVERDLDSDIRGTGIFTIGEIGDETIIQDLRAFAESEEDPRLSRLAEDAIAKIFARRPRDDRAAGIFPTALDAALQTER